MAVARSSDHTKNRTHYGPESTLLLELLFELTWIFVEEDEWPSLVVDELFVSSVVVPFVSVMTVWLLPESGVGTDWPLIVTSVLGGCDEVVWVDWIWMLVFDDPLSDEVPLRDG